MFYQADAIEKLKGVDTKKVSEVAKEISALSQQYPLHVAGFKKKFKLVSWAGEEFTGLRLVGWLTVAVDILSGGEYSKQCGLGDIKVAKILSSPI